MNAASKKYAKKFPEKIKAEMKSQYTKAPEGLEKHHWSYLEEHWNDLLYLTIKDHKTAHRFMIYDAERFMYRTLNGVLLDTKIDHEKYISQILKA